MEKTVRFIDIIRSAIKDWTRGYENNNGDFIGRDISDDEFTKIVGRESRESIALLQRTRNGIGVEELGEINQRRIHRNPRETVEERDIAHEEPITRRAENKEKGIEPEL